MLALLEQVSAELEARGVRCALIGAGALAAHGISRSTADLDLLCIDPAVLEPAFWRRLAAGGAAADVRRGDHDDPLAGVVRVTAPDQRPVDLVVGRPAWMRRALERAIPAKIGRGTVPLATKADLVLLKLYAGSPQDAWDVEQILADRDAGSIAAEVTERLADLPAEAARLWARIRQGGR